MLDTIVIISPSLSEEDAQTIEQMSFARQGIDRKTGELVYQICVGELNGSFDSRIGVKVERQKWEADHVHYKRFGQMIQHKVDCEPYVRIECSLHKILLGHNVFGGPLDLDKSVQYLIRLVNELLDVELPTFEGWRVSQIDVAEAYNLLNFETVQEWFRGAVSASYPRRQPQTYGWGGLYFPGSTTTVKFYHKGPEFYKHDRRRVSKFLDLDSLNKLQEYANRVLRVEVSIKSRKLKFDFDGELPFVHQLTGEYLNNIYDSEVKKVLRDGMEEAETVRTARLVQERLQESYGTRLANTLLGTWFVLSTHGEKYAKSTLPKSTFYDHRKLLLEAGCSWIGTDVKLKEFNRLVPADFVPVRADIRRMDFVDPVVALKLAS